MQLRATVIAAALALTSLACSTAGASETQPSQAAAHQTAPDQAAPGQDADELSLVSALAEDQTFPLDATALDVVEGRVDELHVATGVAWVEGVAVTDTELMIDYSDDRLLSTPLIDLCVRGDAPTGTVELAVCEGAAEPAPVS